MVFIDDKQSLKSARYDFETSESFIPLNSIDPKTKQTWRRHDRSIRLRFELRGPAVGVEFEC